MEQWWNDTDRGRLKCWERNIIQHGWYIDGWVWSNDGMILTGETEVLGEIHYTVLVVGGWMCMEQWWNDTDRGKLKCCEKNIIQCEW